MLNKLKAKATMIAGRTGLKLKKYSPEILVGVGIVGMIGTVVLASKATLEVDVVVRGHQYKMDKINTAANKHDVSSDIVFDTKEEAKEVLTQMVAIVESHGVVSTSDLNELAGLSYDSNDSQYVWKNLDKAKVKKCEHGFEIVMPKATHLKPDPMYAEYSKADYQKDLFVTHVQTSVDFIKLYAPAVTLGIFSITCILGAHNIMKRRNVALMAAYKVVDETFRDYRKRVVDQYGDDVDRNLKYGITNETLVVEELDEATGKTKKVKKNVQKIGEGLSEYATLFNDQSSTMWSRTPGGNMLFINAQQQFANYVLHSRGHVFLNEVYEYLGLPHTQAGAVVGWVRGNGDDFIDFGALELNSQEDLYDSYKADKTIVLDFNVDGVVYDMI